MKAALAAVLSFVLATAPAAQAQVVSGRVAALPSAGVALPVSPALQLSAPSLSLSAPLAPSLASAPSAPAVHVARAVLPAASAGAAPVRPVELFPGRVPAALQPLHAAPMGAEPGGELDALHNLNLRERELTAAFDEKKAEDVPVEDAAAPPNGPKRPRPEVPAARTPKASPPAPPAPPSRPGLLKRLWASPVAGVAASVLGATAFGLGVWHIMGVARAQEFLSTYLIEWTLSLDNLVVLSTVLHALPEKIRPKVLSWGILGAVIMRMGMVSAGMGLAAASPMVFVGFGVFLLTVAAKMFKPEWDVIGLAFKKAKTAFAPKEPKPKKERKGFFANPFVWGLLAVIGYDAVFALDSVPVALAISSSVFIIVAANVFSVLGLRSLYAILHTLEEKFPHLQKGVAFVLVFVALKMIAGPLLGFHVGSLASLLVVLAFLGISMLIPSKKR